MEVNESVPVGSPGGRAESSDRKNESALVLRKKIAEQGKKIAELETAIDTILSFKRGDQGKSNVFSTMCKVEIYHVQLFGAI